ncbi:hypothetical protein SLEP1_g30798 [Rubroshorea leprosula]|uniref:Uncharacterized protein n=1 Tax=Rubroshorea leprosula TaxID=152421 RepID=A0AAV5K9C4_9ROSI|nr:hypothetical protein SLEP1_g30798 [Rubroshorea leprosula]
MEKAKVAVFVTGVDTSATETKVTVLIHSAEQLENYAKTEEAKVEELIKAVADSGAKIIVSGEAVGEMALHFCERYKYIDLPSSFFLFHNNSQLCSFLSSSESDASLLKDFDS